MPKSTPFFIAVGRYRNPSNAKILIHRFGFIHFHKRIHTCLSIKYTFSKPIFKNVLEEVVIRLAESTLSGSYKYLIFFITAFDPNKMYGQIMSIVIALLKTR